MVSARRLSCAKIRGVCADNPVERGRILPQKRFSMRGLTEVEGGGYRLAL